MLVFQNNVVYYILHFNSYYAANDARRGFVWRCHVILMRTSNNVIHAVTLNPHGNGQLNEHHHHVGMSSLAGATSHRNKKRWTSGRNQIHRFAARAPLPNERSSSYECSSTEHREHPDLLTASTPHAAPPRKLVSPKFCHAFATHLKSYRILSPPLYLRAISKYASHNSPC